MSLFDIMKYIPGMKNLNAKVGIEMFSKKIIEHVDHPVNKYMATLAFEDTEFIKEGWIEFLVKHPGPEIPKEYMPPWNLQFKNIKRPDTPQGWKLYDMDVSSAMDTLKGLIESHVPEFHGKRLMFAIMKVDRDKKEVPCSVAILENDKKIAYDIILK